MQVAVPALRLSDRKHPLPPLRAYGGASGEVREQASPGDFSAVLTTHYEAEDRQLTSKVCIVYRGLAYSRTSTEVDLGGVNGLIYCDGLKKNLSQTDLVEEIPALGDGVPGPAGNLENGLSGSGSRRGWRPGRVGGEPPNP